MNEQLLKKVLKDKYGDFTPIRLTGGYTNETFLLKGVNPPLVVKIAQSLNQDIKNEINGLTMAQVTGVVPKVFDLIEVNDAQLVVMEYRIGTNGQSILDNNDLERTKELYKSLGEALSKRIHSIKYNFIPNGIRECHLDELNLNLDFVPESLRLTSKVMLQKLKHNKEEWVLTHGDYGIHNVLFAEDNTLTVLDWEWTEWGNPLTDIAWVGWFTRLHYPDHADLLNTLFIEAYTRNTVVDLSPEILKTYCVYKVWKVLNKVQNAPLEVQQEWIRRLNWTIECDNF